MKPNKRQRTRTAILILIASIVVTMTAGIVCIAEDVPVGTTMYVFFATHSASTGADAAPDASPTYAVYEDATTSFATGTFYTLGSPTTSWQASISTGSWTPGKFYNIKMVASVGSVSASEWRGPYLATATRTVAGMIPSDLQRIGGSTSTITGPASTLTFAAGTISTFAAGGTVVANGGTIAGLVGTMNISSGSITLDKIALGTLTSGASTFGGITSTGSLHIGSLLVDATATIGGTTTFTGPVNTSTVTFGTLALTNASNLASLTIGTVTSAGNVTGSVGSVLTSVGSVIASVTPSGGSVGSVTGNVGGSVGSVLTSVGSVIASVTPSGGNVGSVTGNVGGSVGSVLTSVGSVIASVTPSGGSVGSVTISVPDSVGVGTLLTRLPGVATISGGTFSIGGNALTTGSGASAADIWSYGTRSIGTVSTSIPDSAGIGTLLTRLPGVATITTGGTFSIGGNALPSASGAMSQAEHDALMAIFRRTP